MRARLWALHHGVATPELPQPALVRSRAGHAGLAGRVCRRCRLGGGRADPGAARYRREHGRGVGVPVAARAGGAAGRAGLAARHQGRLLPPVVLRHLGFRMLPARRPGPEQQGPPAPTMLTPCAPPAGGRGAGAAHAAGPFAALAALSCSCSGPTTAPAFIIRRLMSDIGLIC